MKNLDLLINGDVNSIYNELLKINLSPISRHISYSDYREYLRSGAPGVEHYLLLAYISLAFSGKKIYDIGTYYGNSSIALTYNPKVHVVSYDIVDLKRVASLPHNVEYRIGDFREDPDVLKSPFILIDVDPHDGIQEKEFHEFFLKNKYRGLVAWDDIHLPLMNPWWNSINEPNVKKVDLTRVGHHSGTGLLIYT